MKFTIGTGTETALKVLELTFPFSTEQLATAFRKRVKETHPDSNPNAVKGDFQKVKEAYDALKNLTFFKDGGVKETFTHKHDHEEYGQGVGVTKNGKTCDTCDGRGFDYTTRMVEKEVDCHHCEGTGEFIKFVACKKCKNGEYYNLKGEHLGKCYSCKGTGVFKLRTGRECFSCWGTGKVGTYEYERTTEKVKCYKCDGKGEILIHNPVIRKGAVTGKKR